MNKAIRMWLHREQGEPGMISDLEEELYTKVTQNASLNHKIPSFTFDKETILLTAQKERNKDEVWLQEEKQEGRV